VRARVLVPVLLVAFAVLVPACGSTCTLETSCTRSDTSIELPLTAANTTIDGARVDLCRDGLCERTFLELEPGPEGPDRRGVRCPTQPRVGSLACARKDGTSPIVFFWSGAYGGEITVRLFVRTPAGAEDLLAERKGTMVREDYVVDGECGDPKRCSQWVMR
jgi:hypothetical protein